MEGFVTLLPQGLSSGNFPILVLFLLFPTWYLAFLCTASSSAGDEGQPRQQELRETEQKHLRVRQSGTRARSAPTSAEGSTGNAHCPCPQGHGSPYTSQEGALGRMTTRTDTGTFRQRLREPKSELQREGQIRPSPLPHSPERHQTGDTGARTGGKKGEKGLGVALEHLSHHPNPLRGSSCSSRDE